MFYTYSQVNSGGVFKKPALHVIIEADSYEEANKRFLELDDVYFDGVENGLDCHCCGDRWYPHWNDNLATEEPTVYHKPVSTQAKEDEFGGFLYDPNKILFATVYYKDGTRKNFRSRQK